MSKSAINIFLYGLFMDESLLASKDVHPTESAIGYVDGFRLHIGQRATLLPEPHSRAYGVLMQVSPDDVAALYSEPSVADYVPESVTVELEDGSRVEATCYNLPGDKLAGANKAYAESLLELATRLGFPDSYLGQIRQARE